MSAVDRMSEGYVPSHDIDAEVGHQGQLFVANLIDAFAHGTVEVKTDEKAQQTGNVYIEFRCKGRPSGIATTEAEMWVFVVGDLILAAPSARVLEEAREAYTTFGSKSCGRGSHPTEGVTPKLTWLAERLAGIPS